MLMLFPSYGPRSFPPRPLAKGGSANTYDARGVDLLSAIQRSTDPYTWGFDGNGQLGNGGITNQLSPVQVSGLGPVAALAGGHHHQRDQPGAGGGGGSAMAGMTLDSTGAWH